MKRIVSTAIMAVTLMPVFAQSGTNSPYSQYGLGVLSDRSTGYQRGMNGVGVAFHDRNKINILNPASYAGVDSLTFIFDVGLSVQKTTFKESGNKITANNGDFEYAVGSFRAMKNLGIAFGILPYTNVGYSYTSKSSINYNPENSWTSSYSSTTTNTGSGGLHEGFIGVGYAPFQGFSLGINMGYLWGSINRSVVGSVTDTYATSITKQYSTSVTSYNVELGAQYEYALNTKDKLTLGATYRLGHKLHSTSDLSIISSDTSKVSIKNGIELPTRVSVGVGYTHDTKWRLGLDYTLDRWSKVGYPEMKALSNGQFEYNVANGLFNDRHKVNLGGEYCESERGRTFASRIHYRAGVSYTTPYLKVNGQDGPREIAASLGFGFPIMNGYLNSGRRYPMVNISGQWARTSMPGAITENTFCVNVGITFSEKWFAKWKFE